MNRGQHCPYNFKLIDFAKCIQKSKKSLAPKNDPVSKKQKPTEAQEQTPAPSSKKAQPSQSQQPKCKFFVSSKYQCSQHEACEEGRQKKCYLPLSKNF